jgi:2-polyprenyl-6-methoxyphenol hydroxylase-like FAD-dependent oxidoreductase
MALEDAMYLAKLLRDLQGEHELAFELFERDRKPRVERVVAEGRRRSSSKKRETSGGRLIGSGSVRTFTHTRQSSGSVLFWSARSTSQE